MTDVYSVNLYHMPSEDVLQFRRTFYLSHKESFETPNDWLGRIKESIHRCDFGKLTEYLLIDKFICELGRDEISTFQNVKSWAIEQLCEMASKQIQANGDDSQGNYKNAEIMTTGENHDFLKVEINIDDDFSNVCTQNDSSESEDRKISEMVTLQTQKSLDKKYGKKIIDTKPNLIKQSKNVKGFTVDQKNRYHCVDCDKVFGQRITYMRHSRMHSDKRLYSCGICDKVYSRSSYLEKHLRCHDLDSSVDTKTFECHLCKFQFLAIHGLRMHMNRKHVVEIKNEFQCKHCNGVFVKQDLLDDHLRQVHGMSISYKCPHCSRKFDQMSSMQDHLRIHSEAKPFMCEACGNAFKTKKQLYLHMARHTNERRFKCGECGLMLKSRPNYKNHMRQHTGERPFKCDQCERTFVQRANYLKHLRWHTGERPHGCAYCEKRFPTAYDMKLHINSIHTGFKPFACDICDRSFAQPSTLRVHRLRVHKQTTH